MQYACGDLTQAETAVEDAKKVLDFWLTEQDYINLAQATVDAYRACDKFCKSNVVTDSFLPGIEQRSDLLNAFVQHALVKFADVTDGFFHEVKQNAAKNCWHARVHKGTLSLTAHFVGRNSDRSSARPALYLASLASRNLDLFATSATDDIGTLTHVHCQLLHGGWGVPQVISLVIPKANQEWPSHATALSIPEVNVTQEEQIREELTLQLLTGLQESNNEEQAG